MSGKSEGWPQGEPAFEEEFSDSLGARRLPAEWLLATHRRTFRPPFDVYETDHQIVIKVEIAGMGEDDFTLSLDGRLLQISGIRRDTGGKLAYQRMEINYGEFRLDIRLPHAVAQSEIEARYDKGFLSVYVPRRPNQRRIPVTEASS
jgi:HSP20 family molecular chaperone IbpA